MSVQLPLCASDGRCMVRQSASGSTLAFKLLFRTRNERTLAAFVVYLPNVVTRYSLGTRSYTTHSADSCRCSPHAIVILRRAEQPQGPSALLPTDESATGPRLLHLPTKPGHTPRCRRPHGDTDAAQHPRPPGGKQTPSMHMATAAAHPRPPRRVLARRASHARDDLQDRHAAIADRDGLLGTGGAQEGQRRVEHLLVCTAS